MKICSLPTEYTIPQMLKKHRSLQSQQRFHHPAATVLIVGLERGGSIFDSYRREGREGIVVNEVLKPNKPLFRAFWSLLGGA